MSCGPYTCSPGAGCAESCNPTAGSSSGCSTGYFCNGSGICQDGCVPRNTANIIANGGFNFDISGWTSVDPISWIAQDAVGCARSGSLAFHDAILNSSCLRISGGTLYNVGLMLKGSLVNCELGWFGDATWVNPVFTDAFFLDSAPDWKGEGVSLPAPAGTQGAVIHCENGEPGQAQIDRVFMSPSGGGTTF
jgi:hypothetical protein